MQEMRKGNRRVTDAKFQTHDPKVASKVFVDDKNTFFWRNTLMGITGEQYSDIQQAAVRQTIRYKDGRLKYSWKLC